MNRLTGSTSPYLLQHADNPVDWWQWGEDAFAEAQRRGVPIFLSIGYAACHWCHVMAHESFEDAETAAYLNEHFVAIKVDREERPDVDAVYMQATQAMTGQGGWPMSVFLTPAAQPFYCGTYFPPRPGHGMPSFRQLLEALTDAWTNRHDEVVAAGQRIVDGLTPAVPASSSERGIDSVSLAGAITSLRRDFDGQHGGFGRAPKFPPSMVLEFLLRHHARTGSADALHMAEATLVAMARGGMYDQLAGGFARYSVDQRWIVPHFEKMLYDNALLLRVYLHWWRLTGDPLAERIARETADFLVRDLGTAEGGFASALDADTPVDGHAVEGATYVWTPDQLVDTLGPEDGAWAASLLEVTPAGTFERGASTLQLRVDPDDPTRWARVRQVLSAVRAQRAQPTRDDKVVAAWNGLAVAALAEAGALLDEPRWIAGAERAAELVLRVHKPARRLARVSRDGMAGSPAAVLEDYADLAEGLLVLYAVTGESHWLADARDCLNQVLALFGDGGGGMYDTAADAEPLVVRPRDPSDGATPSGAAAAAGALLTYAAYTGSSRHRDAAAALLSSADELARAAPRFAGWWLAVAEAFESGPIEVAIVGAADDLTRARMHRFALRSASPGLVVAVGAASSAAATTPDDSPVPLLAGRPTVDGQATAYVCRGFVCQAPTTSESELASLLGVRLDGE